MKEELFYEKRSFGLFSLRRDCANYYGGMRLIEAALAAKESHLYTKETMTYMLWNRRQEFPCALGILDCWLHGGLSRGCIVTCEVEVVCCVLSRITDWGDHIRSYLLRGVIPFGRRVADVEFELCFGRQRD